MPRTLTPKLLFALLQKVSLGQDQPCDITDVPIEALETLEIPHPFVAEVVSEDSSVDGGGIGRMARCNNWFEEQSGSAADGVSRQ